MKKKRLLCLLAFFAFHAQLWAQSRSITGIVKDETGTGLPGASVVIRGTTTGAQTDINGAYQVAVPGPDAVLVFSYLGYTTQEIPVGTQTQVNLTLQPDTKTLQQVVVVGYGVQRKADVTGSISSVKAEDIANRPVASADQALQGKASGVLITTNQGTPGTAPSVRIRGIGTTGNSNPLYVVDGMFVDDISYLNPADIASMDVLKDASALAIYGVRGANGVIIITTKTGKAGTTQFSYQGYAGFTQATTRRVKLANAQEFGTLVNQVVQNNNLDNNANDALPFANPASLGTGTNWLNEIFQRGIIQSHQVAAAGGSEKNTYNLSLNYFSQEGIVKTSKFERYSLRFNNTYQATKFLKLGNNIALTYAQSNNIPTSVVGTAYSADPTVLPRDASGNFGFSTQNTVANPVAQLFYNNSKTNGARLVGNIFGEVNFLKAFTFRSNLGIDLNFTRSNNYTPFYRVSSTQFTNNSTLTKENDVNSTWLWENTLTYNQTFNRIHNITALIGYTTQYASLDKLIGSRTNVPGYSSDVQYLSLGSPNNQSVTDNPDNSPYVFTYVSNLLRVNYNLMDRYLLTVSVRRDGSSRFHPNNRYAFFPALGLGWRLSEENFIKRYNLFDNLKLRASYGKLGNTNIPNYLYYPRISSNLPAVFGPSQTPQIGATEENPTAVNLTWEVVTQMDIGLEMGFLKNQLSFEVDYYNRKTSDMIVNVNVGNGQQLPSNAASVRNQGFEFNANWRQDFDNFKYSIGANLTTVDNKVTSLGNGGVPIIGGSLGNGLTATLTDVGLPIGAFYGYQVAGIFQNEAEVTTSAQKGAHPGDLIFRDVNNDGQNDAKDRVYLGTPIPKVFWGLNTSFTYKSFDLSIDIQGSHGNKIYNGKQAVRFGNQNFETVFLNAWTPTNPSTTQPRVSNGGPNFDVSSFFTQPGGFVRLRTVQLGYTLPKAALDKIRLKSLRVYINALNPITITKYKGFSPEVGGNDPNSPLNRGVDISIIPVYATYTAGLNLGF